MRKNILFAINRLREKLWFRPLIFCVVSILGALIAKLADATSIHEIVPEIKSESLGDLLNTISTSMLVIAIFAVGSMISAFSAASSIATPRSFKLIIADDVSQNALSVFIGAFIYSIVAMVALKNGYYGTAGHFTLLVFTLLFFTLVILTFLRWVERISKLGRMGHTIKLVENAAFQSIKNRLELPNLGGIAVNPSTVKGLAVFCETSGYVQQINMSRLQEIAEKLDILITINAIQDSFATLDKPLFYISNQSYPVVVDDFSELINAFTVGHIRYFDEDPRFGLITLTEIASRALSPGINDPGTAIQIIDSHVRLFSLWNNASTITVEKKITFDRIAVPEIVISDLFEDAFRPIARDGAANIEVTLRLQKAYTSLYAIDNFAIKKAALHHSYQSFERAVIANDFEDDINQLKSASLFTKQL